jgi:SAM-dependent methyltransferase
MEQFFETGRDIVDQALVSAPVQPTGHGHAVEIGSGLGRICLALADHFDEVTGIDIAPSMVERATDLVDNPKVHFELGDGTTLSNLADGSVDFLLTFTVFQHQPTTDHLAGYLREAGRVLRPGGVIAAQWNNIPADEYAKRVAKWRRRRALSKLPLVPKRWALDAHVARQAEAPFLGTTATVEFMRSACEAAGLRPAGTKGEGTLFAWIWAQAEG